MYIYGKVALGNSGKTTARLIYIACLGESIHICNQIDVSETMTSIILIHETQKDVKNQTFLVAVVAGEGAMCRPGEPLRLTSSSGNIANVLTEETKLGSADCPWMIQVCELVVLITATAYTNPDAIGQEFRSIKP